eukprot:CAMPEP_0184404182 /NCGR_PEP_ID=MMETSP0007-20130409/85806_1 /TAXON_ID=97485 /ORGANISM="Prymnesium parvum, Strain Texoma1" /LENGTH=64 /DNA_ID=CAMNT_0026760323 /DNA_START=105 /DNA_END=299 /DNA_ORIENTATION=-
MDRASDRHLPRRKASDGGAWGDAKITLDGRGPCIGDGRSGQHRIGGSGQEVDGRLFEGATLSRN